MINFCCPKRISAMKEINLFHKSGKIQSIRNCRISAADHHHGFIFIKSSVAMRAIMNTASNKIFFVFNPENSRSRARCNDNGTGKIFARIRDDFFDFGKQLYGKHFTVFRFCSEPFRTRLHLHTERKAVDPLVEAGVIINDIRQSHLSAHGHFFYNQSIQSRAGSIKSCRIACGASSDNHHIINMFHLHSPLAFRCFLILLYTFF